MKENKLPYHLKPGFKVPENYFGGLEETIMRRMNGQQSLEGSYKGNPGFGVPDSYFDSLEERVIQNVGLKENQGKVVSFYKKRNFYYAAAVAAVFVGIISTLLYNPVTPAFSVDSVELSTLENYIDEGYLELDYNEISTFITEEGYSLGISTSGLSDEEVLNYINENVEDPSYLLE